MYKTLMVKLNPSKIQHEALVETMHVFNDACNYIGKIASERGCASKVLLQRIVYYDVRERFKLSAQLTIRAIAKVVEAYKRDRLICPKFRENGAVVYDQRILSWKKLDLVSIVTIQGRMKIPIIIGDYQKDRMDRVRGQADLIYRKGIFYLAVIVEVPEETKFNPIGVLGIDLGIVNLAVDNDGETFSGSDLKKVKQKYATQRKKLQKVKTKSAKRHLKQISSREKRYQRNVNHCISKKIVAKAKDTKKLIALENLKGIRSHVTVRKAQRSYLHSWAFYQLKTFIEYKATIVGVPITFVNPRDTSHICPRCRTNKKGNRPNRDTFRCVQCGFAGLADHVAAINIAARAAVNQPIVSGIFNHFNLSQEQAHLL